jgi:ligand-binding SRPBCC domain-containing protein
MGFTVLTQAPIQMRVGTLIDYRLSLRRIPVRWQSEITAWEPPARFVDEQRRGPYRLWIHEHRFQPLGRGTTVEDRVRYAPLGGKIINRFLVAPDLKRIFDYRRRVLLQIFGNGSNGEREDPPGSVSPNASRSPR